MEGSKLLDEKGNALENMFVQIDSRLKFRAQQEALQLKIPLRKVIETCLIEHFERNDKISEGLEVEVI